MFQTIFEIKSLIFLDIRPLLKMASGGSSETLVPIYQTTRRYMLDEGSVYSHRTNLQHAVLSISPVTALQYLITSRLLFGKRVSPAGYEILTIKSAIDSYIRYEWGVFAVNPIRGKIKMKMKGVRVIAIKI